MNQPNPVLIKKASGDIVPFSEEKLAQSLKRAGAKQETIDTILDKVKSKLYQGITTKKIYQSAFSILKAISRPVAAKYHLKKAIMELGPSGFPFEKFVAEILKHKGYQVTVGKIIEGHCVNHEIDVIAEKNHHHFMIECKYHNQPGIACDVKIPLYIYARFKDVEKKWLELPGHGTKFHQGWVVTNTKFTADAIQYGTCMDLHLMGWNFPEKENIRTQIELYGLYPITCLTTLTKSEKQQLLEKKIVLCKELFQNVSLLKQIGISPSRISDILEESSNLSHELVKDAIR